MMSFCQNCDNVGIPSILKLVFSLSVLYSKLEGICFVIVKKLVCIFLFYDSPVVLSSLYSTITVAYLYGPL